MLSLPHELLLVEEIIVREADIIIGFINAWFRSRYLLPLQSLLVVVGPFLHRARQFISILRSAHLSPWESWRRPRDDLTGNIQILEINILGNLANLFAKRRVVFNANFWQEAWIIVVRDIVALVGILGAVSSHLENREIGPQRLRSSVAKSSTSCAPRCGADGIASGQLWVSPVKRHIERRVEGDILQMLLLFPDVFILRHDIFENFFLLLLFLLFDDMLYCQLLLNLLGVCTFGHCFGIIS